MSLEVGVCEYILKYFYLYINSDLAHMTIFWHYQANTITLYEYPFGWMTLHILFIEISNTLNQDE